MWVPIVLTHPPAHVEPRGSVQVVGEPQIAMALGTASRHDSGGRSTLQLPVAGDMVVVGVGVCRPTRGYSSRGCPCSHSATRLKPTTRARFRSILDVHVVPRPGQVELARVRHADVQKWVAELSAEGSAASALYGHSFPDRLDTVADARVAARAVALQSSTGAGTGHGVRAALETAKRDPLIRVSAIQRAFRMATPTGLAPAAG